MLLLVWEELYKTVARICLMIENPCIIMLIEGMEEEKVVRVVLQDLLGHNPFTGKNDHSLMPCAKRFY